MTTNGDITTKDIFPKTQEEEAVSGAMGLMSWVGGGNDIVPAWWSRERDKQLRIQVHNSDALSGTVGTFRDMMTAIPFQVIPKDKSIKAHVIQAEEITRNLLEQTESRSNFTAKGWDSGYGPFIQDIVSQDNGGFFAIEGPGPPDGPLTGPPTKLIHLDSGQCWRTQSREYPITYTDYDGEMYKLHRTRIISVSSMSDPRVDMFGVGFCAVSRALHMAQHLMDIARYKEEKLGSRPTRGIMVVEGGGPNEVRSIENVLAGQREALNNSGFSRYAMVPIIGIRNGQLTLLDLVSLPDGFDDVKSAQLGVWIISLAFGVDPRQLAFALNISGQTKADATIQHIKMRGKGPGTIIQQVQRQLNARYLPDHLRMVFDWQDDDQDEMVANIRNVRSERHERDINAKLVSVRVAREQMLEDGDINRAQFEEMELQDGRLPDGHPVLALFHSTDPVFQQLLSLSVPDPLTHPDKEFLLTQVEERLIQVRTLAMTEMDPKSTKQIQQAQAALEFLKGQIETEQAEQQQEEDTEEAEEPEPEEEQEVVTEVKQIDDERIISLAPTEAQEADYRRAATTEKCTNCAFNTHNLHCDLFNFTFTKGFVCDRWLERTEKELKVELAPERYA